MTTFDSKAAWIAVAAILTFAIGLIGGIRIQSRRTPEPRHAPGKPISTPPKERTAASPSPKAQGTRPESKAEPEDMPSEDRLRLGQDIWDGMASQENAEYMALRARFLQLDSDLARFFLDKASDPEGKGIEYSNGTQIAIACGGPEIISLLEAICVDPTPKGRHDRMLAMMVLAGGAVPPRPKHLVVEGELLRRARALLSSSEPYSHELGTALVAYSERSEALPALMEIAVKDPSAGVRQIAISALGRIGGPETLAFIRENRAALGQGLTPPAPPPSGSPLMVGDPLARVIDDAIEEIEERLQIPASR